MLLPPLRLHNNYITKKGLYSYKLAARHQLKRIGVVPLSIVNQISRSVKNKEKARQLLNLHELKKPSDNLFGHFGKGGFVYDRKKAPFLDIPDLTGCEVRATQLKPYVSFNAPKIEKAKLPKNDLPVKLSSE